MKYEATLSDLEIDKLSKKVSKALSIPQEEALGLIYEEWDTIEMLFNKYTKLKSIVAHFIEEVNLSYKIA